MSVTATEIMSRENNPFLDQRPRKLKVFMGVFGTSSSITLNNVQTRQGTLFVAGSPYINRTFRRVGCLIQIVTGAPAGELTFTFRDSGDAVVWTSNGINIAATLPSPTGYRLLIVETSPVRILSGGRLLVEYTAGDASNALQVGRTGTNILDAQTRSSTYTGTYAESGTRSTSWSLWE